MMRKVFIMLLMPLALSMGCGKNNEAGPKDEKKCEVTKIVMGNDELTFEYDEEGRVSVCHRKEVSGEDIFISSDKFSYFNDRIEVRMYNEGQLNNTFFYKLNGAGKIMSETNTAYAEFLSTFMYDANGYLTEEANPESSSGGTLDLKYENDNLVWRLYKLGEDGEDLTDEVSFNYNTNEANFPYSSYFTDLFSLAFNDFHRHVLYEGGYFGKKSKNLLVEDGSRIYTYGKNSQNEVNRITVKYPKNEDWGESNYSIEYDCD